MVLLLCRVPPNNKNLKVLLVFLCILYLIYSLNAPYLRGVLGIQTSASGDFIDKFQPTIAMILLGLNTVSLFAG
jgi:hypothetical protein